MMMTISKKFGNGGKELGKQLSDSLNIPSYEKTIILDSGDYIKIYYEEK